jgi:hypothetical protein
MRADVCKARHDLAPCSHCEFYRAHEGIDPTEGLTPSAALDSTADLDG